jgi:polyisoprenoid-binding protein YceI
MLGIDVKTNTSTMKKIALLFAFAFAGLISKAQIYIGTDKTVISFFSHTAMEDIAATNKVCKAVVLKADSGKFVIQVSNKAFEFKSGLMQEHFNENYIESDKYPYCKFSGKILEKINYAKNGTYKITMDGILDVHGVKKPRKIDGTLTVNGDEVTVDSKFMVSMKDHDIKIPEAVGNKLTDSIELTVKAVLAKKK